MAEHASPLSDCTCSPGGPDDIRHDVGCPCRVDRRWDGGDESRVQALMAENQLLREQIAIADDSLANRRVRDLIAENERLRTDKEHLQRDLRRANKDIDAYLNFRDA